MKRLITPGVAVIAVVLGLGVGCGGSKLHVKEIAATENPNEQISRFENELNQARNDRVNVLSPTWFERAESSSAVAKDHQNRKSSLERIFEAVATGRAQLAKANEGARVARTALPDAIKARDDARKAGAAEFEKDYGETEARFRSLTEAIERNNLKSAQREQPQVTRAFRDLELRAIKEKALGQARTILGEADKREARRITPVTYAEAMTRLNDAEAFIAKDRYNEEEMTRRANEAFFHANRLQSILNESLSMQKKNPEEISLHMEGVLGRITDSLSAPDMRDRSFSTQIENIEGSIAGLHKDRTYLADRTKQQEVRIADLSGKLAKAEGLTVAQREAKEKLEAEKRFNALYGEVRKTFGDEEADVYKQDDRLLIRLKAMRFPVGQSVIMPENYPLLSKVQQAIRTFGEPNVVIEGHTDSTGSAALNEHLSQQRAEAVKQYFVANRTVDESKIIPVGHGPSRPIAPNTTNEGRAMNRRIDVVLVPSVSRVE